MNISRVRNLNAAEISQTQPTLDRMTRAGIGFPGPHWIPVGCVIWRHAQSQEQSSAFERHLQPAQGAAAPGLSVIELPLQPGRKISRTSIRFAGGITSKKEHETTTESGLKACLTQK